MISNSSSKKLNTSNFFSLSRCWKKNFAKISHAQHRQDPKTALISGFAKSYVPFTSDRKNTLKIVLKSGRISDKTLKHRRHLITEFKNFTWNQSTSIRALFNRINYFSILWKNLYLKKYLAAMNSTKTTTKISNILIAGYMTRPKAKAKRQYTWFFSHTRSHHYL